MGGVGRYVRKRCTSTYDVPLLTKVVCWMLEDLSKKNIDFETFVAA